MDLSQPWHRLFGISLMDLFRDQPVQVELEKDLSLKIQRLDIVVLRLLMEPITIPLPDGFDNLGAHNLLTFKSHQQALDTWTLDELVGHWVNYRKQISPTMDELLPVEDFRLYAVSVRFPKGLSETVDLLPLSKAVYEVKHFSGVIRIVVINELPAEQQNALFHLFSTQRKLVTFGKNNYRIKSNETSTLIHKLFERYREEGDTMADLLQELTQQTVKEILDEASPQELLKRLRGIPTEELLRGIPPEERVKGLPAEERIKGLPAEERIKGLPAEELLAAMTPEAREALIRHIQSKLPPQS